MIFARILIVRVVGRGRSCAFLSVTMHLLTGNSDPNCGAAYNAAIDDTTFGTINGCGRTNPSNGVAKPSGQPVCS
jgi:hypothetical protein